MRHYRSRPLISAILSILFGLVPTIFVLVHVFIISSPVLAASPDTLKESITQTSQKIQREAISIATSLKDGEKSCEPTDESSCDFYQKCNFAKRCQYDQEWPTRLTPEQALAIYQRLKTELGIDIPLILDKDRLDKLQDAALVSALQPDGCAYLASTAISYSPYAHAGTYIACALNPRKSDYDRFTLRGILSSTYPDLSSSEIGILEQRLREIYTSKAPGALLETTLFVNDIISIPGIVSAIRSAPSTVPKAFLLVKKYATNIPQLLPRVLGIFRKGDVTVSASTLASLARYSDEGIDLIPQVLYRLKHTNPTKFIKSSRQGALVPAWRSSYALKDVPEVYSDMKMMIAKVSSEFVPIFGFPGPNQSVYFVTGDGMVTLSGSKNVIGYYMHDRGVVINIALTLSNLSSSAKSITSTLTHEYIHWATNLAGSKSVFNKKLFSLVSGSNQEAHPLYAFMEGYTEYVSVRILKKLGYYTGSYAYPPQVEAVARFLGNGKYDHLFFEALKRQDIGYIIKKYGWTESQFIAWVMKNVPPLVRDVTLRRVEQGDKLQTGIQKVSAINLRPEQVQSIDFYDDARVTDSTRNTYELIKNLNAIVDTSKQDKLYLGSAADIYSLSIAQSVATTLQMSGGTLTLDQLNHSDSVSAVIEDLESMTVSEEVVMPDDERKIGEIEWQPLDPELPTSVDVSDVSREFLKYAITTDEAHTEATPTGDPRLESPKNITPDSIPKQDGFFQRIINWFSSFL